MPTVLFNIPCTYSFRSPTTNQWTAHGATKPATQSFSSHLTCTQSQAFYCPLQLLLIKCWVTLALHNSWWCWLHWCTQSGNVDCSLCCISPLFISSPSSLCSSQPKISPVGKLFVICHLPHINYCPSHGLSCTLAAIPSSQQRYTSPTCVHHWTLSSILHGPSSHDNESNTFPQKHHKPLIQWGSITS
jgi:hypothetical protein